jgi:hypothetical protein
VDPSYYYYENHSYDDCYSWGAESFNYVTNYLRVGYNSTYGLPYYMAYMTWHDVNIPPGSTIDFVSLHYSPYENTSTTSSFKFQFEDTDHALACAYAYPASRSYVNNFNHAATYTSAWTANTWRSFYDFSSGLQDVIDRPGWSSGNSVGLAWSAYNATGSYRQIYSYDGGSAPYLYVEYTEGGGTDDNYEENDTWQSAYDLISYEYIWLSNIDGYGIQADDDWYQIYVTTGDERVQIDAQFTHSEGDIDISLHDSAGGLLAWSNSTSDDEFINYEVNSGGTYYIRVYYADAGNQYDLWWDDIQPANTPPVLSDGDVDPASGTCTDDYTFVVKYTDADGDQAVQRDLHVHYSSGAPIPGSPFDMSLFAGSDPSAGQWYHVILQGFSEEDTYGYYFEYSDGTDSARFPASGYLTFTVSNCGEPVIRIEPTVGPGAELTFSGQADGVDAFREGEGAFDPMAQLEESSQNGLILTFEIPEYEIIDVEQEGFKFGRVFMPNSGTTMEVGKPELPTYGRFFTFPAGAQIEIELVDAVTETISDVLVFPSQGPQADVMDYAEESPFAFDEEFYSRDELYTGNIFSVDEAAVLRGTHLTAIRFYPFQYNPAQRELTIYKSATVRVNFIGGTSALSTNDHWAKSFDSVLQKLIVNYDQLATPQESPHQESANGAEFLIITHPDFLTAANALATFRNSQGLDTEVRTTDQTGTTAADIGDYIQDAYDTWTPAPEFVLFLGDAEFIPTNYQTAHPYQPYNNALIGTDLYYATVDGSDFFPDIFTGRIPVDTLVQAQDIVDDIIAYEQNPVSDTAFYENVSIAAYFQDHYYSNDPPPDGFEDRRFVLTS